ncbi:MAG: hypothetical protein LBI64_00705 [Coriobacteriales bacterium]|jgi:predicted  nucleic acid-binding Zn-ribbon protein|nr:hypothetical protein [Coriobacteriales bacterium]
MSELCDANDLLELTRADLALLRLKKQLDNLPQRQWLITLRTKRAEVETKAAQVARMRKECDQMIRALVDEEATLRARTAEAQIKIDETSNYKEVASLSREIESFAKRLEKIEFDTLGQMERSDRITAVEAQVATALKKLNRQDSELLAAYQTDGAVIQKEQVTTQQQRADLIAALPPELVARYERAREAKGGVGAAQLEGSHCNGCRVELSEGQLARLRSGPPIGECPYCHRLLVVEAQ